MELFKFMPYRKEFFEKRLLRFTPAVLFNDPFEGRVTKSSAVKELHGKYKGIAEGGKSSRALSIEEFEAFEYYNNHAHRLGILSLTRSKHSLLMWAHYAENHTGIILGVDSTHSFFNQTVTPKTSLDRTSGINFPLLGKLFPVVYERVRVEQAPLDGGYFSLDEFLQKSDEWIYEKEYRMFMNLTDSVKTSKDIDKEKEHHMWFIGRLKTGRVQGKDEYISLFEIPEDAITRVVLGVRSDKSKILNDFNAAVKNNPKLSHIKIEYAELHKELYHIEHIPM